MADQTYRATIEVADAGSEQIAAYKQAWAEAKAQFEATAGSMAELDNAVTQTNATTAEAAAALQESTAAHVENAAAIRESAAASGEEALSAKEMAAAEREAALAAREQAEAQVQANEAIRAAAEGNIGFADSMGPVGMAVVTASMAIGVLVEDFNQLAEAGAEGELAFTRLEAVVNANIGPFDQYAAAIEEADAQGMQFGLSASQVENALARLTTIVPDMATDLRILSAAENVSALTGKDLDSVIVQLGRAIETGNTGPLARMGIIITDNTGAVLKHADATQILTAVEQKYGDVAAQVADTGAGSLAKVDAAQKDLDESAGKFFTDSTQGWNEATAAVDANTAAMIKAGDAWQGFGGTVNKVMFDIPSKLAGLGFAVTENIRGIQDYTGAQAQANMEALIAADAADKHAVSIGMDTAAVKENADAVAAQKSALDIASQAADDASAATEAYTLATSDGLDKAVQVTQQKMAELVQQLDIINQAADKAKQTGDAHAEALDTAMAQSVQDAEAKTTSVLAALNSLIGPAGTSGFDAGKAYSDGLARGLGTNKQPGFSQVPSENYTGTGSGSLFGLPYGQTPQPSDIVPPAIQFPGTMDQNAAAAIGEGTAKAHKGGGGGSKNAPSAQDLEAQAQQLQLTKDNTDASRALAQATQEVSDKDKEYTRSLQGVNDALQANKEAEAADTQLNAAKANLTATQAASAKSSADDAADANKLAISIHQVTDRLAELDREAAQNMAPLKKNLEDDTQAMQDLDRATAKYDHDATDALNGLAEKEYQLAQDTKKIMAPLQEALDGASQAYAAAQQHVQDLSDAEANQLAPIDLKLNEIAQERNNLQRANTLETEAQSVANLTARMKDLVPGSEQYNALLKSQQDAQKNLGLDEQTDKLTKQKDAIQDRYAVEIQAAKLQEQAAADQQKAAQAAYDSQKKIQDQAKANLDEQMQNIQHEQTLYDQQAADKKYDAQKKIDDDNAAILSQQKVDAQRAASDKAYLAELQHEQQEQQFTASQNAYNWGLAVKAAQDAVAQLEVPYSQQAADLDALKQKIQDQKTAYDESVQPTLDDLGKIKDGTQKALDVFKDNQDAAKEADAWSKAVKAGGEGLAAMHDAGPNVAGDLDKIRSMTDGANTSLGTFNTTLAGMPASTNTAISQIGGTFGKYFGQPSDPNFDASVSIAWMLNTHNEKGFYATWAEQTKIFLGPQGFQGIFDDQLPIVKADIEGQFDGWATDFNTKGVAAGDAFADGFIGAVQKRLGSDAPPIPPPGGTAPPGKAFGGDVNARTAYMVGEYGPELFVPSANGTIIPNNQLGSGSGFGGGTSVNVGEVHVHLHSSLPLTSNEIPTQAARAFREALFRESVASGDAQYYQTRRTR